MRRLHQNSFIQINPLLYFLPTHVQRGWINERYVNLLMYEGIVDYVDNINYSGLFNHVRSYGIDELQNFYETLDGSIQSSKFAVLWVDEYYLSVSIRYNTHHFVHPLIVFGYNIEKEQYNTIFFDIMKGQVILGIDSNELFCAVFGVKKYYMHGSNIDALTTTLSVFMPKTEIKGEFHLDVFIKNLSQYLCCENDHGTEWYDTQRKEVFNNRGVIYGVQIYHALIDELKSSECRINYKSLHDFIKHKLFLYERLLYIAEEYDVGQTLTCLIERYGKHANQLERIRLLNLKYQVKIGDFPVALSFDHDFIEKLINALKTGYDNELELLPMILRELQSIKYPLGFVFDHSIKSYDISLQEAGEGWYSNIITMDHFYSNRIDYICCSDDISLEDIIIILNDEYKYYVRINGLRSSLVHSIHIPIMQINKIECRALNKINLTLNTICLPGQDLSAKVFIPEIVRGFDGINHIEILDEFNRFVFTGPDPYIFKTGFAINASHFRFINVEMKTVGTSRKAQLFFSTIGSQNWTELQMVEFDTIPDESFHEYIIDMQSNSLWNGFIGGIRFDPAHFDSNCQWKPDVLSECVIKSLIIRSDVSEND